MRRSQHNQRKARKRRQFNAALKRIYDSGVDIDTYYRGLACQVAVDLTVPPVQRELERRFFKGLDILPDTTPSTLRADVEAILLHLKPTDFGSM